MLLRAFRHLNLSPPDHVPGLRPRGVLGQDRPDSEPRFAVHRGDLRHGYRRGLPRCDVWHFQLPGGQFGFLIFVNIFVFLLAFFLDFFELAFIIIPLLGPAAEKLGIDLIWFGVILGVNMQTSFMHPPFGFALFYLRSVAPRESYLDRLTGKRMEPVTTGQIYWGAIPFVVIQIIMVLLVILFPSMVMHYKGAASKIDPNKVKIEIPQIDLPPPLDFGPPAKN